MINAQENVTKALQQWHFTLLEEVNDKLVLAYVNEVIQNQNQNQNKEIQPERNKPIVIPDELKNAFQNKAQPKTNYKNFTPGKQRGFADFISSAK